MAQGIFSVLSTLLCFFSVPILPLSEALPSPSTQIFSPYRVKEYTVFRPQRPLRQLCLSVLLILTSIMCSPECCLLTCFPSSSWNLQAYAYLNNVRTFHRTNRGFSPLQLYRAVSTTLSLYSGNSQEFYSLLSFCPLTAFPQSLFLLLSDPHIQHFQIFTTTLYHWEGCLFPLSWVAHSEGKLPPCEDWAWATRGPPNRARLVTRQHYRQKDPSTLLEGSIMLYAPDPNC